jgi:hypothetical protein
MTRRYGSLKTEALSTSGSSHDPDLGYTVTR